MPIPDTLYAKVDDAALAYQVYGSGEHRVVFVPTAFWNVDLAWDWAPHRSAVRYLSHRTIAGLAGKCGSCFQAGWRVFASRRYVR